MMGYDDNTKTNQMSIRRSTTRERLNERIEGAKYRIKADGLIIEECNQALKLLDKNKELETLVNILRD